MESIETLRRIWANILDLEEDEFDNNDNFMNLGGDSVKAIQLLGEVASYSADLNLGSFLKNATVESLWQIISRHGEGASLNGHSDNGDTSPAMTEDLDGSVADVLASTLEKAGIAKDDVLGLAPISCMQDFFLMTMARGVNSTNYVYQVQGRHLKQGLKDLTQLLHAKNPIFRTNIVDVGDGSFLQVLRARSDAAPWSYPSSLEAHLQEVVYTNVLLDVSPIRYAFVQEDQDHGGSSFLVISMHHTHCDAFTRFLITKEMLRIIQSPSAYACASNPENPWYGDFVKHLSRAAPPEAVRRFWDEYIRGADLANVHPSSQAVIGGAVDGKIADTIAVPSMSGASGIASTQLVFAAWALALARLSGLRDIVFGYLCHGRSSTSFPDVRRVMGPLLNGLPLRITLDKDGEPVTSLLQRVDEHVAVTREWDQGFNPTYPNVDGRPWTQTSINIKSDVHGANGNSSVIEDDGSEPVVTEVIPRPDLERFTIEGCWAVMMSIRQQRGVYHVFFQYQSALIGHARAEALYQDFKGFMKALTMAEGKSVGDLLVADF